MSRRSGIRFADKDMRQRCRRSTSPHWRGADILATDPVLTSTPAGDGLELRPGGSWIAANVTILETLADAAGPQLDRARAVRLDMAGLRELDTVGAWLLEKLTRRA